MFDAKLAGTKAYLVVTQRPFEHEGDNGVMNSFLSLQPILLEDGSPAQESDFPDNGSVWWMLRPGTRGFAEPGRLLIGALEEAKSAGEANKSWYQVRLDSIEPARPSELVEIIQAPLNWISEPREIVAQHRALPLDHPPLDKIYLGEGQGELYLPLASGLMVMSYLGRVLDRSRRAS